MSWECPECSEMNPDDAMLRCVCGYSREELPDENSSTLPTPADVAVEPYSPWKVVWKFVKFILIVHLVAWMVLISKQTAGRPHPMGKTFMVTAIAMTGLYIHPLAKVMGDKNILLKPLILLRDGLVAVGWRLYPDDDAERQFMWYMIYGKLETSIFADIKTYRKNEEKTIYTPQEYEKYFSRLNSNMEGFATLPMRDKEFRGLRYAYFAQAAKKYLVFYGWYLDKKDGVEYYSEPGSEYMKNVRKHFDLFLQMREYTREHSPKKYNAFITREDEWWYYMQLYILGANTSLVYEDLYLNQFDCNGPHVFEFLKARETILLHLYSDPRYPVREKDSEYKSQFNNKPYAPLAVFKLIKEKCKNPEVQAYPMRPTKEHSSTTFLPSSNTHE